MSVQSEKERLIRKNRDAEREMYVNLRSSIRKNETVDGINAVLKFLNIKERADASLTQEEQIRYAEENLFIKTRHIKLDDGWYFTAALPMLARSKSGEWYAVLPAANGGCKYTDNGKKVKITAKNADMFDGEAICFYKTMGDKNISEFGLFSFIWGCTCVKDRITVLSASALAVIAGMLLPWANSFIFSRIIPTGNASGALSAAALILSAVIAAALMRLMQSLILTNSMVRAGAYVQSGIFSRLLRIKPEFFKNTKSGELSRMITEFSDISRIVSVRSISACIGMALSFLYLIQIRIYAPEMFAWVIYVTIILGAMIAAEGVMNSRWQKRCADSLSKMSGFGYEMFSGMEQIKLNGAEARVLRRWSEKYRDAAICADKPFFLKYAPAFYKLLTVISTAMIFLLGHNASTSDYIAFFAAYGAYMAAVSGASSVIEAIGAFHSSYSVTKSILTAECEAYDGKEIPDKLHGEIDISDVYFRYSDDMPYVLNGISAHIKSGESVGIVGVSGCGKSTLIRLLLGFETPDEGSIYIDGFDIRELNLKSFRRKIGTVLQNSELILGDIYSNITMTKPNATLEEVADAVRAAGIAEDINAMPMGLYTSVSPESNTFSGGQRQRILIARALISKPAILILDEATSALDGATQTEIIDNVNRLECTKIIVAHRLSTIEKCDRIFVIDKGVIAGEGTYDELMNNNELFKKLAKKQIPE